MGILLSLLILKIGYQNAKLAILSLMDSSPDLKLEKSIQKLILNTKGSKDVTHLKLRQSGTFFFGEAHLKVSKNLDVKRAHDISESIEKKIKEKYPKIESFLIHIEPFKENIQKVLIPIKNNHGLDSEVIGHFGRANYFLFALLEDNQIISWYVKENPFVNKKVRAGLSAANYVLSEKIDIIVLKRIGEIAFHTLRDGYVDLFLTKGKTAGKVIEYINTKKLKKLDKPTHLSEK